MYGYIYKTTNLVNGKIYVGQKKSSKFLGNKYLGSGKYLKCAIKHYGENSFAVSLICAAESKDELDELEKYYIEKFNANDHDVGYNIAFGAVGGDTYTNLSDCDKQLRNKRYSNSRKANINTYVAIHKGKDNKRIEISLLESYLLNGWERGRSSDWQKKLDSSHRGIKQSDEWIKKRVNSGWKNKSPDEYAEMVQKHRKSAIRQMANTPKDERIKRARNANKFKGHKCCFVNNGVEMHFIYKEDLQKYLDDGFELGMLKKVKKSDAEREKIQ